MRQVVLHRYKEMLQRINAMFAAILEGVATSLSKVLQRRRLEGWIELWVIQGFS